MNGEYIKLYLLRTDDISLPKMADVTRRPENNIKILNSCVHQH